MVSAIVRSVDLFSAILVRGSSALAILYNSLPRRRGVTCGTTGLFFREANVENKTGVRVGGGVPLDTKLNNNDTSTSTILYNLSGVCGAGLSSGVLYRVTMSLNTSMPFFVGNNYVEDRKVNRVLAPCPALGGNCVLLSGNSAGPSAGRVCGHLSSRGAILTSARGILGYLRDGSLSALSRYVCGTFRAM